MEQSNDGTKRVRGWLLFKVRDPEGLEALVDKLSDELFFEAGGEHDFVIVRTDVVVGDYDLVVPVDAKDGESFRAARAQIEAKLEPTAVAILTVKKHRPMPPHMADGYIDPEEAEAYPTNRLQVGRQRSSPGANAWG